MLRYLYGDQLKQHPKLAHSMFLDRADQFHRRQGWDVTVDENGEERDAYDLQNPLYVLWEGSDGRHLGSLRLLPTTGPCMINDHFLHLTGGGPIVSPVIWECTRFCLARGASPRVAGALMLAGGEVMQGFGLDHLAGVFDARMVRIYRSIGASPDIVGSTGTGRDLVAVGLWAFTPAAQASVARRAGLSLDVSHLWFDRAFGRMADPGTQTRRCA